MKDGTIFKVPPAEWLNDSEFKKKCQPAFKS